MSIRKSKFFKKTPLRSSIKTTPPFTYSSHVAFQRRWKLLCYSISTWWTLSKVAVSSHFASGSGTVKRVNIKQERRHWQSIGEPHAECGRAFAERISKIAQTLRNTNGETMTQVRAFSFDLVKTVRIDEAHEEVQSLSDSIRQFLLHKGAKFIKSYMFQLQLRHFWVKI